MNYRLGVSGLKGGIFLVMNTKRQVPKNIHRFCDSYKTMWTTCGEDDAIYEIYFSIILISIIFLRLFLNIFIS